MEACRMSRIAAQTWARLGRESLQGQALSAIRAIPDVTDRLVAATDAGGRRHYVVKLANSEPDVQDTQSRGLSVTTRELEIQGHESGRYLDLKCHDAAGHDAFDLIGGELADRLAMGHESAPEVVVRVLAKWRRFWSQTPRKILSIDQQLGLFAELWFLSIWLIPKVGPLTAVRRWRGPFAGRHDFEWAENSVEVKATQSTRGPVHRVNGLDQLLPPENGRLFVFSVVLREEAGATNTLPAAIAACRTSMESDAEALTLFEQGLVQAGYSPADDDEYERLRLRVVQEALYGVHADFPRLTRPQISGGLPSGIERVEYDINLGGFTHLCVARTPADAALL